jgi:hypothetical protein
VLHPLENLGYNRRERQNTPFSTPPQTPEGAKQVSLILEAQYQAELIKKLKRMYPGCIVLKNDPTYIQGFPDLTVLYNDHWALLEVKRAKNAPLRPNQKHYVSKASDMSFAAVIYPENEETVLRDLSRLFFS